MSEPDDPVERQRRRRRHPAERTLSRASGLLLLVMITQAAFGYALVGLTDADGVRTTHFLLALVVTALIVVCARAARRLPWDGRREMALRGLTVPLVFMVFLQLVMGAMARGFLPGYSADVRMTHIGIGLLVTILVAVVHILAIGPSILLSARREYEASRERLERQA